VVTFIRRRWQSAPPGAGLAVPGALPGKLETCCSLVCVCDSQNYAEYESIGVAIAGAASVAIAGTLSPSAKRRGDSFGGVCLYVRLAEAVLRVGLYVCLSVCMYVCSMYVCVVCVCVYVLSMGNFIMASGVRVGSTRDTRTVCMYVCM